MYKDERDIFYYDAVPHVWHKKYKGLPPFSHYELARALAHLFKIGAAEVTKPTHQATYITEIDLYSDRCEVLIGFSDPNAADPTFNDRPLKKRRVVAKVGDEGLEHSAHVVWYYESTGKNSPCAFYLEGATGLSSTAIVRFLNQLIRFFCKTFPTHFSAPDPNGVVNLDGTPKRINLRPRVELRGHPSAEFIRDLKGGEISELELITESKAANVWDANGYAIEDHRGVLLKPSPRKHIPKAKAFVDAVLNAGAKHDYEKSRVVFKTAGNIRKNVAFYTQNYQLVNDLKYVKKSRIKALGGNLPNAFDAINKPIIGEMRKITSGGATPLSNKKIVI